MTNLMTDTELREKLLRDLTDICFDNGGVTKPMAEKLADYVTQYGNTREREGRIDERESMHFGRKYGRDYQATLEDLEEENDKRLAELKEEV